MKRRWPWKQHAAVVAGLAVACAVTPVVAAPGPPVAASVADRVQLLVDAYDAGFAWVDLAPVIVPVPSAATASAVIRHTHAVIARFDRAHARAHRAADARDAKLASMVPDGPGLVPAFDELEAITGVLCDATQQLVAGAVASAGELPAERRAQLQACVERHLDDARGDLACAEADLAAARTRRAYALGLLEVAEYRVTVEHLAELREVLEARGLLV